MINLGPFDLNDDTMTEFENLVNGQVDERQEETCQDYGTEETETEEEH